ncbi:MAG: hypothetical protein JO122_17050 [Acetobacteraceae bacterium]|nr:hypothetical protein [Acetobacteraceae bacterium]
MTDYRTMLTGLAAAQAATVTTAAAVWVRFAEFALREGVLLSATLLSGRSTAEDPIPRLCGLYSGWLRGVADLPRTSALVFLGELDRIRGPRAVPREQTDAAHTRPP